MLVMSKHVGRSLRSINSSRAQGGYNVLRSGSETGVTCLSINAEDLSVVAIGTEVIFTSTKADSRTNANRQVISDEIDI